MRASTWGRVSYEKNIGAFLQLGARVPVVCRVLGARS